MSIDYRHNGKASREPGQQRQQLEDILKKGQELWERFRNIFDSVGRERETLLPLTQRMAGIQIAREELELASKESAVSRVTEQHLRMIAGKLAEEAEKAGTAGQEEADHPALDLRSALQHGMEAGERAFAAMGRILAAHSTPLQGAIAELREQLDAAVVLGASKSEQNFHGALVVQCNKLSLLKPENPQDAYYVLEQWDLTRRLFLDSFSGHLETVAKRLKELPDAK